MQTDKSPKNVTRNVVIHSQGHQRSSGISDFVKHKAVSINSISINSLIQVHFLYYTLANTAKKTKGKG